MYFLKLENVFVQTPKMYLTKMQNVFVQIAQCILTNYKMYLSKLTNISEKILNVFVHIITTWQTPPMLLNGRQFYFSIQQLILIQPQPCFFAFFQDPF